MAKINMFIPGIKAKKFSGGLLTLFEYANGLVDLGHEVTIIPISPSEYPQWFKPKFQILFIQHRIHFLKLIKAVFQSNKKQLLKEVLKEILLVLGSRGSYSFKRAAHIEWVRDLIPDADISLATSYETAIVTLLYGKGKKYYFAQHYEPYFAIDCDNPIYAEFDAKITYSFPLQLIANSTWLARKIKEEHNREVPVCLNAIDHRQYFPDGNPPDIRQKFIVLSYGGRNARWKGFEEAAQAIALARKQIPNLEWRVYGDALLPPNNPIASYKSLGFITGAALRQAYSQAHVVLCPSWYESFPLYPLEAMACRTAVITTPFGTEDYAFHKRNAYVVPPRNPEAMARALIELYNNEDLRQRLAQQACHDAKNYTWERSVRRMAELLELL